MTTKVVEVFFTVEVTVDEDKFTPEFMQEFRDQMYDFNTLDDHLKHLAQLKVRGIDNLDHRFPREFVEGYGEIGDFGISARIVNQEEEISR